MAKFIEVKCKKCANTQQVFTHASLEVNCNKCGNVLTSPKGGKATIF